MSYVSKLYKFINTYFFFLTVSHRDFFFQKNSLTCPVFFFFRSRN